MATLTRHDRIARLVSLLMWGMCTLATAVILSVLLLVVGYLAYLGANALLPWEKLVTFFTEVPTADPKNPGGMKHAVVGTLMLLAMASAVGVPLGMLAGIYLAEYSENSRLAAPVRFVADVLAGVPSIVVGILGYELVVVPMSRLVNVQYSGIAGSLALAFIMIPIVARTTEEMLRLVPGSYREASIALGATKARTILWVVIPSATGSVVTGVMLAMARVAGETAPLLFTAGMSRLLTYDPTQPFPALTTQIYRFVSGPYPAERELGYAGILVLIVLIFCINLLIRYVTRKSRPMG
ncbi:MAG: phosphate ABC transporter permease PstA [Tepidisphaerales bacterium]